MQGIWQPAHESEILCVYMALGWTDLGIRKSFLGQACAERQLLGIH